jgi:hypothetical protein
MTLAEGIKPALRRILASFGLLHSVRLLHVFIRHGVRGLRGYRVAEETPKRTAAFVHRYAEAFGSVRAEPPPDAKRFLLIGGVATKRVEIELCLAKALEMAGWRSLPIQIDGTITAKRNMSPYYNLLDSMTVCNWADDFDLTDFRDEAETVVRGASSLEQLVAYRVGTVRIGGHAVSTARRQLRVGTLDFENEGIRSRLIDCVAASMASAAMAERLVRELRPSLVLTEDTAYTPRGEILDMCGQLGIPLIRWYLAHKASALMLKRYSQSNRDHDINSLSDASWRFMREMDWSMDRSKRLKRELTIGYASKDWYNEDGAQFNKHELDVGAVRGRLGLDPLKKTAIIFSHVGWDASFGRGEDLFGNYDEWLIETVRAACANEELQWVIKIHPGHIGKRHWHGRRMPDEEDVLRLRFGRLPNHVSVLPACTDISTLSLFPIMDYCLTVRGTVGLEAACRGIPVLTGGTGRYDRKGFTIDSATPQQYLERISRIQILPPLSPPQIELAERFAYGLFLLRPLPLSSISNVYDRTSAFENLSTAVEVHLKSRKAWEEAPDLRAFVTWATKSEDEDFLLRLDLDFIDDRGDPRERIS